MRLRMFRRTRRGPSPPVGEGCFLVRQPGTKIVVLDDDPVEVHEQAVRLHEEHARQCRERGDEKTARLADERAERARQRAIAVCRSLALRRD